MPANVVNSLLGTRIEKVIFHSNPKEKQCQRSYHTIALISHDSKVMLKVSKIGLNSIWTNNFQMFKLDLEKKEESEIKMRTSIGP